VDVPALLGEDAGVQALQYQAISVLNLHIRVWVGYHGALHPDVVIVIEIQEIFPGELSVIIGYDGVGHLETENDVLDEIHRLLRADLHQGLASIHLVNFSTATSRWVKPLVAFLKGP
jgi:hypothetical protein